MGKLQYKLRSIVVVAT